MQALELAPAGTPLGQLALGWEAQRQAAVARTLVAQRVLLPVLA
jgi:hypothetical protein